MRIQIKRRTAAEWGSTNPVLSAGEPAWDSTNNIFKIGNGVDTWSALPPISGGGGGGGGLTLSDLDPILDGYADIGQIITDHGDLTGLGDDDHPQYYNEARLNPLLDGYSIVGHTHPQYFSFADLDPILDGYADIGQIITDHGDLTGLGDDDHPQYYNEARLNPILDGYSTVDHTHSQYVTLADLDPILDGYAGGGLPTGGTAGQVLAKIDSADYNVEWVNPASGGGLSLPDLDPILDGYVKDDELTAIIDSGTLVGSLTYNIILQNTFENSLATVGQQVVPGFFFTPQANKRYRIKAYLLTQTSNASNGPRPGFNVPGGTAATAAYQQASNSDTGSAIRYYRNNNSFAATTGHAVANSSLLSTADIYIIAGSAPTGNLQVTLGKEIASDTARMMAGSFLQVQVINEGLALGALPEVLDGYYASLDHNHTEYVTLPDLDPILDGYSGGGLPTGGTAGQVLAKIDATDYNVEWVNPSSGGGLTLPDLDPILDGYATTGSIITDHGALTGLGDDDHPQYYNEARLNPVLDGYSPTNHNHTEYVTLPDLDPILDGYAGGGLPTGGTAGQVLAKIDSADYNVEWVNPSSGGGDDGYLFASYKFEDHFLANGLDQNATWFQDVSGTGAGNTILSPGIIGAPGVMRMSTGTTATGRTSLFLGPLLGNNINLGGGLVYDWQARVRINYVADSNQNYELIAGLTTSTGGGTEVHSIGFVINDSSANWVCRTNDNYNVTNTGSGVAVQENTWTYLRFTVNSTATEAKFYINQTLVATVTSNIPTSTSPFSDGLVLGQRIFKSAGTTAINFDIDYIALSITT